jgi:2-oxoadipate dioxygenase/decarboxylase-like protein
MENKMDLLNLVRKKLIKNLWNNYQNSIPCFSHMRDQLKNNGNKNLVLDHFAIIDLPGRNSGISNLCQIFSALGFIVQGADYLPDKQNDFLWMAEIDATKKPANVVLPQVVVADFRIEELPIAAKKVINKYIDQIPKSPIRKIQILSGKTYLGDRSSANELLQILVTYFSGREWPLPSRHDFKLIHEVNELLAWTLLFGRIPNHFTISVHLLRQFKTFEKFISFLRNDIGLNLNENGGIIKGTESQGIKQASTQGKPIQVQLADGYCTIPGPFIEFIWRYPKGEKNPISWQDYFTGFIPQNANKVVESLYTAI